MAKSNHENESKNVIEWFLQRNYVILHLLMESARLPKMLISTKYAINL